MTLIVYETTHHETLPGLLELAQSEFSRVLVFLDEATFVNLSGGNDTTAEWPRVEFVQRPPGEANRQFIARLFQAVDDLSAEHLWVNTLANNWLLFAWQLKKRPALRVVLTIHAVETWRRGRATSLRGISEVAARRMLHRRITHYRILSPTLQDALARYFPGATIRFIPPRFFHGVPPVPEGAIPGTLRIAIPGSVEEKRRNFRVVKRFCERLSIGASDVPPVILVLVGDAGSAFARRTVEGLREYGGERLTLRYFTESLDEQTFQYELRRANLLWSPLQLQTWGIRGEKELYGVTTLSGILADIIASGKTALVPRAIPMPDWLEPALIRYRDEKDVLSILAGFSEVLQPARTEAVARALSFLRAENFQEEFLSLLR